MELHKSENIVKNMFSQLYFKTGNNFIMCTSNILNTEMLS